MTPLRIAAHISAAEWGGAERRSLALLAGLARRGHNVIVYCNTERIADKAREHGLVAIVSPLRGDIRIDNALALAHRLRQQRPDVLIIVTFRRLLLGAFAGRLARVPRIVARVGLATDTARSAKYRFLLKHWVDDVVLNAESLRAPFIASLPRNAHAHVHVIPNGVSRRTPDVARDDARSSIGVPSDAFVIGSVGRLVRQKRFDRLVEAVAELESVHLVIAGDGYMRDALEQLVRTRGVADRVRLLGHREDVGLVHSAIDAYIVSSDQEGMSSGMLEAMAAGLPVVSTPVSGAAEALNGEPRCGIIAGFSPQSLVAAVDALRRAPPLCSTLGRAAASAARDCYAVDTMTDRWETLLLAQTAPR